MTPEDKEFIRDEFEKFGRIVKSGFDGVDERFKNIDEKFKSIDHQFKIVFDQLRILGSDLHDVKITLASLLKMVADRDREINNMDLRLRRVEQHLGLLSV
ncbi:MAG: hypothetical protein AAB415_01890 [Patescibacteria group bacterium]